jgi:hypothetical protein
MHCDVISISTPRTCSACLRFVGTERQGPSKPAPGRAKTALRKLLARAPDRYIEHFDSDARKVMRAGIVSKKADSPYRSGRQGSNPSAG